MVSTINTRPLAILFDWDNTLANTWPVIYSSLFITFEAMGHEPLTLEEIKSGKNGIHRSLRNSFPQIFGSDWEKARDIYYKAFENNHLKKIEPLLYVNEILEFLLTADIYLAVVSNKTGKYLREEVRHLGLSGYFSNIVGAMDAEHDKPHIEPVYLALNGSSINPCTDVWFIGDSNVDMECAHNSGCRPIFFQNSEKNAEISFVNDTMHSLCSYKQLKEILEKWS